jgi:hypothetical protein
MRKAEGFEDGKEEGDLRESVCGRTCISMDLFGRSFFWKVEWELENLQVPGIPLR